jgi:hypothetical protein
MTGLEELYLKNISKLKNEIKLLRKEYNQLSTDSEEARAFHADHKGISCESIIQNSEKLHREILTEKWCHKYTLEYLCLLYYESLIDIDKYEELHPSKNFNDSFSYEMLSEHMNDDIAEKIYIKKYESKEEAIERIKWEESI